MKTKTEIFLEKVKAKNYPNHINSDGSLKYDYSKTNYIHSKTKVVISCAIHGDFEQAPEKHLRGQGCIDCSGKKQLTTDLFITKAKEKHLNKYRYTKSVYKDSRSSVIITCPIHGDFKQRADTHLDGRGCFDCGNILKGEANQLSTKDFIEAATKIHGSTYDYSKTDYKNVKLKVIITCRIHGDFEQRPDRHLDSSVGCFDCSVISRSSDRSSFIEQANLIHNNLYGYEEVVYVNARTKVILNCQDHGSFTQEPSDHLRGAGCPRCADNLKGYTRSQFKSRCLHNNTLGTLYIIRCFNETEEFYKVGISSTGILARFQYSLPYDYDIVYDLKLEPETVFNTENEILRSFKDIRYTPTIQFSGHTECFSRIEPIQQWLKDNKVI